jgi:hypothetical protein
VPGRFHCTEEGDIELEVLGTFSGKPIELDSPEMRILGVSEKGKLLTLERCYYKNRSFSFPGLATSTIHVNLALIGCHFKVDEPISFQEIACQSEAFDEWLRFGEINVSWSSNPRSATINYSPPDQRVWPISIGADLTLSCTWTAPSKCQYREAKITQKAWVGFRFPMKRPFDELLRLVHRFANFVSFAVDQTLPIQAIQVYLKDVDEQVGGTKRRVPVDVYYSPDSRAAPNLSQIAPPFPLFSFQFVSTRFGDIISRWLDNYETFDSSFNLYFATKTGRDLYLDNRFLMLAQALEAFHRHSSKETAYSTDEYDMLCQALQQAIPEGFKDWLKNRLEYGNELPLRKRLKFLFNGFEPVYSGRKSVKHLVTHIVDTRNYLTHYDERLRNKAARGAEMYKLCVAMETLFQVHMAMLCGFSIDEVVELCKQSQLFSQKFDEIKL